MNRHFASEARKVFAGIHGWWAGCLAGSGEGHVDLLQFRKR